MDTVSQHNLREQTLALLRELEKIEPNNRLLPYSSVIDNSESAAKETLQLYDVHFLKPARGNAMYALKLLHLTVTANIECHQERKTANLNLVPGDVKQ